MYDINLKNVKKSKGFYWIFLGIGIVFLIGLCVFFVYNTQKNESMDSYVMAKEVVVNDRLDSDGNTMYSPVYYYDVNGVEYTCSSHSSSSIYPNDFDKTVYYKSSNPKDCMTGYDKKSSIFFYLFFILPVVFIAVGLINIIKVNKRVKVIKELNQKGKLVKNVPYYLADTGMRVNNRVINKLMVDYKLPNGSVVTLSGDPRFDNKVMDSDGFVDLVIDENNTKNYFIDFEINRLEGNRPEDYFQQVNSNGTVDNQQVINQQTNTNNVF